MLHVVSLAQCATAYTRSWAADSTNARLRMKAENDRSQQEIVLLRGEMGIKDSTENCISQNSLDGTGRPCRGGSQGRSPVEVLLQCIEIPVVAGDVKHAFGDPGVRPDHPARLITPEFFAGDGVDRPYVTVITPDVDDGLLGGAVNC